MAKPSIAVLLAIYNGEKYLATQLQSFHDQSISPEWLVASDDRSRDQSIRILDDTTAHWNECKIVKLTGPAKGYAENFSFLMNNIPDGVDLVALSDQDDAWAPDKLENAYAMIRKISPDVPVLYGSRTLHCDEDMNVLEPSRLLKIKPQFKHALTQNFAGGNTMVLNASAVELVLQALPLTPKDVVHDWWLYQLISGCGGQVIYDDKPSLLYRQHGSNAIGANRGVLAGIRRARDMLNGRYWNWNTANFKAMSRISDLLTPASREIVRNLPGLRQSSSVGRLKTMRHLGLFRSTPLGQIGLWISVALRKF